VVGVTTHTFSTNDEELEAFLDDVENKSETIREALRVYRFQSEGVEDSRLSERQRVGYEWMLESVGENGRLTLEMVETTLAQLLSMKKGLVRQLVVKPLERLGYVVVRPAQSHVNVAVRPPDAVDVPVESSGGESGGSASERMEAILEADVAEVSADD